MYYFTRNLFFYLNTLCILQPKNSTIPVGNKKSTGQVKESIFVLHFLFYIRRIFRSVFNFKITKCFYYKKSEEDFRNNMLSAQQTSKIVIIANIREIYLLILMYCQERAWESGTSSPTRSVM